MAFHFIALLQRILFTSTLYAAIVRCTHLLISLREVRLRSTSLSWLFDAQ